MAAELSIAAAGQAERRIPLTGAFTIGRGHANDLVLEDTRVSRAHALIRPLSRGSYFLLDLGSANGTFLNGRLVTAPVELKDGDSVVIADCKIVFEALDKRLTAFPATVNYDATMETATNVTTEAITILVSDIRNFGRLSEAIPPKELPAFIGAWFKDAGAAIESHGGVIDKFIGDAVMAYWLGGKSPEQGLARGPLDAALELIEMARLYDSQLRARHPELAFAVGCGIHKGEAMFGNMGMSSRRDFTAIGDCVNIAFRLESLCKELGRPVIISEDVMKAAGGAYAYEDLGGQMLKGKTIEVRAYSAAKKVPLKP